MGLRSPLLIRRRIAVVGPALAPSASASTRSKVIDALLGLVVVPVLLVGALVAVLAVGPRPASAHADLLQGSPGPAQRVGGQVDFIDLVFTEMVTEASVSLIDPNDQPVAGQTVVTDGQIIRFEMPALTEVGRYVVRFELISNDGDLVQSGYFFDYELDAFEPVRLGEELLGDDSAATVQRVALVVIGLCLTGLCLIGLLRLQQRRAALAAVTGEGSAASPGESEPA